MGQRASLICWQFSGGAERPRCNSARTDSSLSDTNELTFQNNERLELSNGDELEEVMKLLMIK